MRTFLNTTILLSLIIGFVACSNENEGLKTSIAKQAECIGEMHNGGLDFIFAHLESLGENGNSSLRISTSATKTTSVQLATVSRDYLQATPNFTTVISTNKIECLAVDLDIISSNFTKEGIQTYWKSIINDDSFKSIALSSIEQQAFSKVEQIFLNLSNSTLSERQQYDYIKTNIAQINSTYGSNMVNQSELLCGLLSIMDSSNDYWLNASITTTTTADKPIPFNSYVVQVDAMGYIIGWVRAVIEDQKRYPTQAEYGAHSSDRIQSGLWGALAASGVRAVIKYYC